MLQTIKGPFCVEFVFTCYSKKSTEENVQVNNSCIPFAASVADSPTAITTPEA